MTRKTQVKTMVNKTRLIDANTLPVCKEYCVDEAGYGASFYVVHKSDIDKAQTVDAIELTPGYKPGDVCIYSFDNGNKSSSIVEIVKILNDEKGVAEVKFLKVFTDDSGNGWFDYLLRTSQTMNASFKYLKNITPRGGFDES